MLRKLPVGIIGGGEGATKALRALLHLDTVAISAIVCQAHELVDQIDDSVRVQSVEQLLRRRDIEAVYIATPVSSHVNLAIQVLDSGKHVLIEKPLGLSVKDAAKLRPYIGFTLQTIVAFKKRFNSAVACIRDTLELPTEVHYFWEMPAPNSAWRFERSTSGGGVIMDLGSHVFDLLEFTVGRITELQCSSIFRPSSDAVETEAELRIEFGNGASGRVHLRWGGLTRFSSLRIYDSGRVATIERSGSGPDLFSNGKERTSYDSNIEYRRLFECFYDCIRFGSNSMPGIEDGIRNLNLIESAYQSAETGHAVGTR